MIDPVLVRDIGYAGFGQLLPRKDRVSVNRILGGLSPEVFDRIAPNMRDRPFREGQVLWDRGERSDRVYFPVSGMISLVMPISTGSALEVGNVGREGAVGFETDAAILPSSPRAVMRISGILAYLPASEFAAARQEIPELAQIENTCREWLLVQAQQAAVCNAVHSADARFARWLFRAVEATGSDVIPITQEAVGEMLGLRRTTITMIAQNLQAAGVIRYRRAVVTVVDRSALRAAACGCCSTLGPARWPPAALACTEVPVQVPE